MYWSGDDVYDDELTSLLSIETRLDQADYERKRRREMSACFKCGSPEPVRLGKEGCSDCYDGWPRCPICGGWSDISLHRSHG